MDCKNVTNYVNIRFNIPLDIFKYTVERKKHIYINYITIFLEVCCNIIGLKSFQKWSGIYPIFLLLFSYLKYIAQHV